MNFNEAIDILDDGGCIRRSSWDKSMLFLFRRDYRTLALSDVVDPPVVDYMQRNGISEITEVCDIHLAASTSCGKIYIRPCPSFVIEETANDWEER
jgi:hypothetical protein